MLNQFVTAKTDGDGDTYVEKYGKYATNNDCASANEDVVKILEQLEKNYEAAFGEIPRAKQMKGALMFSSFLLAEICENAPTSVYEEACNRLSWIIQEDDPVETAVNIRGLQTL